MVNRNLVIVIGILVVVFMGFIFVTNMTGNAVTGSVVSEDIVVEEEYFRINEVVEMNNTNESEVKDGKG